VKTSVSACSAPTAPWVTSPCSSQGPTRRRERTVRPRFRHRRWRCPIGRSALPPAPSFRRRRGSGRHVFRSRSEPRSARRARYARRRWRAEPAIDSSYPLEEAAAAFARVGQRSKRGKIVLHVTDD
jgi:hypothetical protein